MSEGQSSQTTANKVEALTRRVRIDLLIAVCALLVSSLATLSSWWQTRVIQQQLSAQIWPYLSTSENFNGQTVSITLGNQGLGPAIVRSARLTVDGKVVDFIGALHAILGPDLMRRRPHGEKMGLALSSTAAGGVLRAGEASTIFAFTSKHFAKSLLIGSNRMSFQLCYCAIVPGTCWKTDTASQDDPQATSACPEIKNDLLHALVAKELNQTF